MVWKDEKTIAALAQYIRLLTGLVFVGLLIWMFAAERIDLETVIKAIISLLAVDRLGMAVASRRDPPDNG
jgi:hypothetical protein